MINEGQYLLTKVGGELIKAKVIEIGRDSLVLETEDGTKFTKYYWEVRKEQ